MMGRGRDDGGVEVGVSSRGRGDGDGGNGVRRHTLWQCNAAAQRGRCGGTRCGSAMGQCNAAAQCGR